MSMSTKSTIHYNDSFHVYHEFTDDLIHIELVVSNDKASNVLDIGFSQAEWDDIEKKIAEGYIKKMGWVCHP